MGFVPVPRATPNVEPYHSSKRSGLHVHGKFADVRSGVIRAVFGRGSSSFDFRFAPKPDVNATPSRETGYSGYCPPR